MVAPGDFLAHAQALSAPDVGEADFLLHLVRGVGKVLGFSLKVVPLILIINIIRIWACFCSTAFPSEPEHSYSALYASKRLIRTM